MVALDSEAAFLAVCEKMKEFNSKNLNGGKIKFRDAVSPELKLIMALGS